MAIMQVVGNLGKDAEQRFTGAGMSVVSFSVADSVYVKGEEITQWVNCTIFGERGEKLVNSLKKGSSVFVSGEFYARKWESNGKSGTSLELNVDRFKWAGRKHDSSDATQDHAPQPVKREQAAPKTQVDDLDDDIQF